MMRMSRTSGMVGLVFALCSPAWAADCDGDLNQSQLDACYGAKFSEADAALNGKYKRIMDCLKPESAVGKPLGEAQRAWLRFRDLECKFQGSVTDGGSIQPMMIAQCLRTLTDQRGKDLDYYLSCEEGDLTCPTVNCGFATSKPTSK